MAEFTAGKYGIKDAFGVPTYGGLRVLNASAGTPKFSQAQFVTFVGVIAGMSEGYVAHREFTVVEKLTGSASGDNASNYIATVTFQGSTSGQKYKVSVPGIKESLMIKEGRRDYTLTPAAISSLKTGIETLLGETMFDDPFVYIHTRQSR